MAANLPTYPSLCAARSPPRSVCALGALSRSCANERVPRLRLAPRSSLGRSILCFRGGAERSAALPRIAALSVCAQELWELGKALQRQASGGRAGERLPRGLCSSSCSSLCSEPAFSSGFQGLTSRISLWVVADGRDTCMSHAAVLPSPQSSQLVQTAALGSCHFSLFICLCSLPSPLPGSALGRLRCGERRCGRLSFGSLFRAGGICPPVRQVPK